MIRALVIAVLLPLLASPAAAQNVTARLENATLHQTLLKLAEQTHQTFVSLDGAGEQDYQDPPDAPRASLEWKETPLAAAVRQVCRFYHCSVHKDGPEYYHFMQGEENSPTEQARDGLVFHIRETQRNVFSQYITGAPRAEHRSTADLTLVVRSEDGPPDSVGVITKISATDANGKPLSVHAPASPSVLALPDERFYTIMLDDLPAGMRRIPRLSGEIAVMKPQEERKLVIPIPKEGEPLHFPIEHQFGPIRVRIMRLHAASNGVEVLLRYSAAGLFWANPLQKADQSLRMRGPFGRLWPLTYRQRVGVESDGQDYVEVEGYRTFDQRPVSLELLVPVRDGAAKTVPFQMENVVLPTTEGEPVEVHDVGDPVEDVLPDQGPRAFLDPKGGAIRFPALGLSDQRGMRLGIGLARREAGGGWSPVRWLERDAFWDPLMVRALAPGTYRVTFRGALMVGEGSGPLRPLGSAEVVVRAGKEAPLPLILTGSPGSPAPTGGQKPPD